MENIISYFLSISFFIFVVILFQISIEGYQSVFFFKDRKTSQSKNYFINFISTLIILNVFGYLIYLISIPSNYLSILIWLIGIYFFYKKKNKIDHKKIFIIILLFSGLIISKTHEDFIAWHFPYLLNIYNESLTLGIGNNEINFVYAPFFSYFQMLFFNDLSKYKFVNIGIFLILCNFIFYHLKNYFTSKNLISSFLIIFIIIKYTRFSEYGYDFLPFLLLVSIYFYYSDCLKNKNKINYNILFLFFVYAISIRSIAIFFIPLLIYIIFSNKDFRIKFDIYFYILILLSISYLTNNFIKSGCIVFFITETCANNKLIPWSVDINKINNFSQHVQLWAKSFYTQKEILDIDEFNKNFRWIKFWIEKHFFYKVFEYVLLLLFIFILLIILAKKVEFKIINKKIFLFTILNILFWFIYLPQLRFGASHFVIIFLILIDNLKIKINYNFINILIIISFVFFNLKNIYRINNEFNRTDKYKFNSFPYISIYENLISKYELNKEYLTVKIIPPK